LRAANEKLTNISLQKDAFLSQISHELRTPMTSIRAFSEILRDTGELSEAQLQRYSGVIHTEAIRLTRLLDDLLDLSVLENGQVTLNLQRGGLHDLLNQAVTTALAGAATPLAVRRDVTAEAVTLYTDMDRLSQVFINLIANAQKYCRADQPELTITVRQDEGQVLIDFVDNGDGIAVDAQALIFEKFSRISGVEGEGAGLGLAICREIMSRLGGDISYLAAVPGTAFRVSLPQANGTEKPVKVRLEAAK
jgi:signal transduction histidine kinase